MSIAANEPEFGELPLPKNGNKWHVISDALRSRPGHWAKIATGERAAQINSTASNIKRANYPAFRPAGSFEAVVRGSDVWARYVGTEATS